MSIPTQPSVSTRTATSSGTESHRSDLNTEEDSSLFQTAISQSPGHGSDTGQSLSHHSQRLEDDLMRFRNAEIDASELEESLIRYENALEEAGIETRAFVEDGQLLIQRSRYSLDRLILPLFDNLLGRPDEDYDNIAFSDMSEQAQRSMVQRYLDDYDPIEIYGERLSTVLSDFHAERASGQDLEQALIDFEENLTAAGITTEGRVEDGQYIWRELSLSADDSADRFWDRFGSFSPSYEDKPFSWLEREQQASVTEFVLDKYLYNSPEALREQRHNLAARLLVPDDSDLATRIGAQTARVERLLESFHDRENPSEGERARLTEETTKLVGLLESGGINSGLWRYNEETNDLQIRYDLNRPPPGMSNADIEDERDRNPYWSRHISMVDMDIRTMTSFASAIARTTLARASYLSLDHLDILGGPRASGPILTLQARLAQTQTVPDNADLELAFQVNMATAQLRLGQGDLQHYEYRLTDAVRARLGDQGWGLHRDHLFSAFHWINEGAVQSRQVRDGGDGDLVPRPASETAFTNAWNESSRETRIEYLGFDVQTWNEIEPLLEQAISAHRQRKAGEFDLTDIVKIGMAMFISYATAGALAPAVTSWLGGSALAGAVGTAVGGAAGSLLSTLIISGDWVTARETFKDIFEGDLKEGLAQIVLNYVGVDTRYAAIVNSATGDEAVEALTEELGLELVRQFGAPFIDGLKSYTPDVVDSYLDDLKNVLLATDDPDVIAEHAIGWWGGELASMLGVTNENGVRLVTSLLDTAVTSGDFDVAALQQFLGEEVVEYLADVPAEVVERLGGADSTLALLGGVAAQLVVNNLDTAIEGDSFIDAARIEFEEFVVDLAENWVEQGGLEAALSWIPGSANWSTEFRDLVLVGHNNGWDKDELQTHLSESSLFSNLVNSYIPEGVAHNYLTRALQYASENGMDTQTILNAATIDMVEILAGAGISQDVVNFLGGNGAMLTQMSHVFGERLIANNGDLDATLRDMEQYARGLAAGHVGSYTQSILAQVLGPKAGQAIEAISGLVEGIAAGWNDEQIDAYVDREILTPLGDSAAAVVIGAFGGEDNFVAGLLGAITDAYVTNPGDEAAARGAAFDYLLSRLGGLVGGSDPAAGDFTLAGPSPFSLAESVSQLIAFANENNWDEQAIQSYVEDQFLNNGLAGNLIDTFFGGLGTRAQLSAVLVEELISVYQETGDPVAVTERFVTFILNPPALVDASGTNAVNPAMLDGSGDGMVIIPASYDPDPAIAAEQALADLPAVPTQIPLLLTGLEQQLQLDRQYLTQLEEQGAPRSEREKAENSIDLLQDMIDEINDLDLNFETLEPIKAVLIPDNPGENLPQSIALQVYAHRNDDGRWEIVDLTDPRSAKVYTADEGEYIEAAWAKFVDVNRLPAGQIAMDPAVRLEVEASDTLYNQYSDGKNAYGLASEGFGLASMLFAVLGVGALVASSVSFGTTAAAAPWLFGAAGLSGAASAGFNIADRLQSGSFEWFSTETALDLLGLAGGITGGLAAGLAAGRATVNGVTVTFQSSRANSFVTIATQADDVATGAGAVVLSVEYMRQIDDIAQRIDLTDAQKQTLIEAKLKEAVAVGAVMVLGVGLSKANFGSAGLNAASPPVLNQNAIGRPVNVIDSATGNSTTVANINDPPNISDGFVTKLNGDVVKINEPRSYERVEINEDGSKTYYKNDLSVTYGADGFPRFNSVQDVYLDPATVLSKNSADHFSAANMAMREALLADPNMAARLGLSDAAVDHIMNGSNAMLKRSPPGYTWHHHENVGKMQLVAFNEHNLFPGGHIGGAAIWAGGGQ